MINGRKKGKVKLAEADIKGLKKVLIALKSGEAVGILPDQVADNVEGLFFDRICITGKKAKKTKKYIEQKIKKPHLKIVK